MENKPPKLYDYEVTITVEEVYTVRAQNELAALMTDLEDPVKITTKKRRIKRQKPFKNNFNNGK